MARHGGPVLVDTNAILECFRVGAWRALSKGYRVETVEECVIETQTGYQNRRAELQIDERELRASLAVVQVVGDAERAVAALSAPDIALDIGEQSLWAHALTRKDIWVLCGPDKASMRFGIRMGFRERLVSLENLLKDAGYQSKDTLKVAYTSKWLDHTLSQIIVAEGAGRS